MKRIFIQILILLSLPIITHADTATWDKSAGATGYYLYFKDSAGVEKHVTIGDVNQYSFSLAPDTYQISISAFNTAGESDRSNVIEYTVAEYVPKPSDPPESMPALPEKPTGLSLIGQGFVMVWEGLKGVFS